MENNEITILGEAIKNEKRLFMLRELMLKKDLTLFENTGSLIAELIVPAIMVLSFQISLEAIGIYLTSVERSDLILSLKI